MSGDTLQLITGLAVIAVGAALYVGVCMVLHVLFDVDESADPEGQTAETLDALGRVVEHEATP